MDKGPAQLDDQNCFAQGTSPKDKGSTEVTDVVDDHDNIFESGIDCYEELAKMKKASSEVIPFPMRKDPLKEKTLEKGRQPTNSAQLKLRPIQNQKQKPNRSLLLELTTRQ